jgi:hypothetical protein
MVHRVNKAISRWPSTRTTVTNLLRSGPLSVRGHLVALAQIERGYRAFGLERARDPANAPRRRRDLSSDLKRHRCIFHHPCPRPLHYHQRHVYFLANLPPGGGRGQARVGFDPGLAWTLRTATPARRPHERSRACSERRFLLIDGDPPIRRAASVRDRVMTYDWRPFVPGCTG